MTYSNLTVELRLSLSFKIWSIYISYSYQMPVLNHDAYSTCSYLSVYMYINWRKYFYVPVILFKDYLKGTCNIKLQHPFLRVQYWACRQKHISMIIWHVCTCFKDTVWTAMPTAWILYIHWNCHHVIRAICPNKWKLLLHIYFVRLDDSRSFDSLLFSTAPVSNGLSGISQNAK